MQPLPPDVKLATMISTLRINYHIHRALEFFALFLLLVAATYIYAFARVGQVDLAAASAATFPVTLWWGYRMSAHAIKARNAFREKLAEYERIYGKLT
jgi:uncharacterized membrane protein YfcA